MSIVLGKWELQRRYTYQCTCISLLTCSWRYARYCRQSGQGRIWVTAAICDGGLSSLSWQVTGLKAIGSGIYKSLTTANQMQGALFHDTGVVVSEG